MADLRLATRGSPLALAQADRVAERLRAAHPGIVVERLVVRTSGDERAEAPIRELGGTGVFTAAVDLAVADGRADCAVHSAKDLPASVADPRLVLAAVPERADVRDCLVGSTLAGLAHGATVASGSIRRRAQLAAHRPDLAFVEVRGNIARRLEAVPDGGAVVVALAALERLGLLEAATEVLSPEVMLPQVGQGALALTCRGEDASARALLAAIDETAHHRCVDAERAFLARLGAGCSAPLGALARTHGDGLELVAVVAQADGSVVVREAMTGTDPEALGRALAGRIVERASAEGIDGLGGLDGAAR